MRPWFGTAALLALVGATLGATVLDGRFRVTVPELATNAGFTDGTRDWHGRGAAQVSGEPPVLTLRARRARHPTWVVTRLALDPARYDHIEVRAEIRAEAAREEAGTWQGAGLRVLATDARGRRLGHWPMRIARGRPGSDWQAVTGTVPVNPRAKTLWFAAFVAADSGALALRGLEISGAVERGAFQALDLALAVAWVGAGALALAALARSARGMPLRWLTVAAAVVLTIGGTMPQPYYHDALAAAGDGVRGAWSLAVRANAGQSAHAPQAGPSARGPGGGASAADGGRDDAGNRNTAAEADANDAHARSSPSDGRRDPRTARRDRAPADGATLTLEVRNGTGHLAAFTVLSLLAGLAYPSRPLARVLRLLTLSACIQVFQTLAVGREPELADMAADGLGIGAGAALAWLALTLTRRVRPIATAG